MVQNRNPRGVPTGGQFAGKTHTEADVSLEVRDQQVDPRQWLYDLVDEYDSIESFDDTVEAAEMLTDAMNAARAMRDQDAHPDDLIRQAQLAKTKAASADLAVDIRMVIPDAHTAEFEAVEHSFDQGSIVGLELKGVNGTPVDEIAGDDIDDLVEELSDSDSSGFVVAASSPAFFAPGRRFSLDLDAGTWAAEGTPD